MALPSPFFHTSLLTSVDARNHVHLIIGATPLAAARTGTSLAAGAKPILVGAPSGEMHYGIQKHIDTGALVQLSRPFQDSDLTTLGRPEVDGVVDAVFVTSARDPQAKHISDTCKRNRIPVNVADAPALCSFGLLSAHSDGPLQIGVTTNGSGCKLASRIRREIAAVLPSGLGSACARLGQVRRRIQEEDRRRSTAKGGAAQGSSAEKERDAGLSPQIADADHPADGGHHDDEGTDDSVDQTAAFNKLVVEADLEAAKTRRSRWLAQVCEYWSLKRLAAVTDEDLANILNSYPGPDAAPAANGSASDPAVPSGRVILAGSGPGHPDLLTRATYRAIQTADLILADKLVPAGVLDLIPRRTPVVIARKFPGNADQAQEELLEQALAGARAGQTVLRLKQGDPFLYGRGGEEVAFFRRHGLGESDGRLRVLPGVTSALSAPLFAGVPVTQRDFADSVLVCTGTGKKGKPPKPPSYRGGRTVVFLMALHRIEGLLRELTTFAPEQEQEEAQARQMQETAAGTGTEPVETDPVAPRDKVQEQTRSAKYRRWLWPLDTPCAVIERASCPDQRVIRTTLRFVAEAIEQEGSRPPGLLVVGKACEALYTPEEGRSWVVEDGFKGLDLDDIDPTRLASLSLRESGAGSA